MKKEQATPLVSITCISFNHEQFIEQCLNGWLMQITNFPFEVVLYDDASTDRTGSVIQEYANRYPNIFNIILSEENQYSRGVRGINAKFNLPRCRGKYIALCEGDDYWTDPYKLQKQVDFLEKNTDFTICWTNYDELKNNVLFKPSWDKDFFESDFFEVNLNNFSTPYCTLTLTALFRASCIKIVPFERMRHSKDNTVYAACLSEGNGAVLNFKSSVYRIHDKGVYSMNAVHKNTKANFLNIVEILFFFPKTRNGHFKFLFNHFRKQAKSQTTILDYFSVWVKIFRIAAKSKSPKTLTFLLSRK
jgi:glycosyltransferase involved in cell wall biosynthesis